MKIKMVVKVLLVLILLIGIGLNYLQLPIPVISQLLIKKDIQKYTISLDSTIKRSQTKNTEDKKQQSRNLVMLHGLGQDQSSWDQVVSVLDTSINIQVPNLFKIVEEDDINYQNIYQSFFDYCEQYDEPIDLCGLSLGGVVALDYTIQNPDKVRSLTLIGTQYVMPKRLLKLQNLVFKIIPEGKFQTMGIDKSHVIRLTESMMDLDFADKLSTIDCQTLILCGKKDSANLKASVEMKDLIVKSNLIIIPDSSHEVNIDSPYVLGDIINNFLDSDID